MEALKFIESTTPRLPQTHRRMASTQEEAEPGRSRDLLVVTQAAVGGRTWV